MIKFRAAYVLSIILLLSSCVTQHPQNAKEFRLGAAKAWTAVVERYTENRSFTKIANAIQGNANKCLSRRVRSVSSTYSVGPKAHGGGFMQHQVVEIDYKPTVVREKGRISLHIQQEHVRGVINVTKKPNGGYYMFVVDVTPTAGDKSNVTIYRTRLGFKNITRAIKGWISGSIKGCPDLTKD